ncbi:unnamed protein product [Mytilus coruscus]|uniref:Uncharacterized protein n=1 Tax=Mytilus coruscus TaxID=42192 RepID=A0A6J8E0P3_MYTCO|nr:unnamed protein product [Mytilus coruscus]
MYLIADNPVNDALKLNEDLKKIHYWSERKTLEQLYCSYIRPVLKYADVVWDTSTLILIHKIESVQIEAARIVTGGTRLTSINLLYKETGWGKLKDRREAHRLTYLYKMSYNITPSYLNNILPERFRNTHKFNTRNANDFQPIAARTSLYSNYFLQSTVKPWNSQTSELQNSPSLLAFKSYF